MITVLMQKYILDHFVSLEVKQANN